MSRTLRHLDDGHSIIIDPESTDPRHVVAAALAEYDGWGEIRPGHWWQAGRAVKALKAQGMITPKRQRRQP